MLIKYRNPGIWPAVVGKRNTDTLGTNPNGKKSIYIRKDWIGKVCQNHAEYAVVNKLKTQGFEVSEKKG